ncbi:MAG: hypothetical protein HW406_2718 [Candidatus Brocadiaceae bacterium]|nr:hypothetical protein [Candidatus Brocadiaceae bacterium]
MEERFALLLYFVFQVLRTCEIFSRRNYKFIRCYNSIVIKLFNNQWSPSKRWRKLMNKKITKLY